VLEDITERKRAEAALHDLSGRLINAQEQERARVARELHDGLSQNLALLVVELELLGQRPPATALQIANRMQELADRMRKLASDVHRISHNLHPAKLKQLGLTAAVNELCQTVLSLHKIRVSFHHSRIPHALPIEMALCLYRVTQECLQNVVKHSGAKHVEVTLALMNNGVHLSVADDGSGLGADPSPTNSALGLISMRERVRSVHGDFRIDSEPGNGTRVSVRIPLPEGTKV
jgi:signal transduction histidine kinase